MRKHAVLSATRRYGHIGDIDCRFCVAIMKACRAALQDLYRAVAILPIEFPRLDAMASQTFTRKYVPSQFPQSAACPAGVADYFETGKTGRPTFDRLKPEIRSVLARDISTWAVGPGTPWNISGVAVVATDGDETHRHEFSGIIRAGGRLSVLVLSCPVNHAPAGLAEEPRREPRKGDADRIRTFHVLHRRWTEETLDIKPRRESEAVNRIE